MGKAGSFVSSPYGLHDMLAVGKAGQDRSPGPPAGSGGTHECAGCSKASAASGLALGARGGGALEAAPPATSASGRRVKILVFLVSRPVGSFFPFLFRHANECAGCWPLSNHTPCMGYRSLLLP